MRITQTQMTDDISLMNPVSGEILPMGAVILFNLRRTSMYRSDSQYFAWQPE